MRQPLFLQSATHDIVRGCVKTSRTAFGGQLPYQGSQRDAPATCELRPATCDLRIIVSCDEAIMLQPLFADYVNFIHYLNEIVVFYKSMVRMIP